ncbi:hypothetical protein [Coleofasciculus sp. H7-2]|uniref:hypothetical protein n=1 Tax=Coleofasciculus sp. H7-2 TaxID=3351545 RepID=UPI00366E9B34
MAFSSYKDIGKVLQEFQVTYTATNFMGATDFNIPDYFREDLEFMLREAVVDNSEFAVCENLIYPVLKEVWKSYHTKFVLWSHKSLTCNQNLYGFPEYILAKRSPLGKFVFEKPYFLLVEAKQDKFDEGWAQCLAEMVAVEKLNDELKLTVFGIVSNGATWQFGKLEGQTFTQNTTPYTIYELDKLFAAVNYVFQQCEIQLNELLTA